MKRILAGTLAFVLFAGVAQAQTKDTSGHHHMRGQEMVAKKLNLSADQQARLKAIHQQERSEMKALKENNALTAEQQKSQGAELRKKYREQTMAIYTPEQKQQIEQFRKDRKVAGNSKAGKKGMHKDAKAHHKGMKDGMNQLNLTDNQKQQIAKLRKENRTAFESIRNDASLSKDQKKEKMEVARKQQMEQMKSILTAEQIQKMESLKKERAATRTKK